MSSNIVYTSVTQLMSSQASLEARIAALGLVLANMELLMADKDDTKIYELDTSQTRIQKTYTGYTEMFAAYERLFKLQQAMMTRANYNANGRIVRLVDSKNFIGRNFQ